MLHRQYIGALTNASFSQDFDTTRIMTVIVTVTGMLNWYLSIPANQDRDLTNIEFMMMNQALVSAVRLDLQVTPSLRGLLDLQHTYRQIILRLKSAAKVNAHEHDTFHTFLARCQKLQQWWLKQREPSEPSADSSPNQERSTNMTNDATVAKLSRASKTSVGRILSAIS